MTNQQKIIIAKLFEGGSIASSGPGQIRLRDSKGNPLLKVSQPTFYWLSRNLLRKKKGIFLLNKSKMRACHGNSFVYKLYKGEVTAPGTQNTPPIIRKTPDRPAHGLMLF